MTDRPRIRIMALSREQQVEVDELEAWALDDPLGAAFEILELRLELSALKKVTGARK